MTLDDILLEAEEKMIKTEQVVVNEFAGVRTGKASAGLVENITAEVYGSIEKAIQKANIGLSPVIQGKLLRLSFPELSTERRQEFVKLIKKMSEDGRVAIRHVRRDAMDLLKKHAHDSGITEDQGKSAEKELQKLTDDYITKIDQHVVHKEKEILTV